MYRVGDIVMVKDLPVGCDNDPLDPILWFNAEMKKMAGRIFFIKDVYESPWGGVRYKLLGDLSSWEWSGGFLIPMCQRTE